MFASCTVRHSHHPTRLQQRTYAYFGLTGTDALIILHHFGCTYQPFVHPKVRGNCSATSAHQPAARRPAARTYSVRVGIRRQPSQQQQYTRADPERDPS